MSKDCLMPKIIDFYPSIKKTDSCWIWLAGKTRAGYGRYKNYYAHRFSYEIHVGKIPEGLVIDHLCRNPSCVNPEHLEPVTIAENNKRGIIAEVARKMQLSKTECRNGHPFDEVNTRRNNRGHRYCYICSRAATERYFRKKHEFIV